MSQVRVGRELGVACEGLQRRRVICYNAVWVVWEGGFSMFDRITVEPGKMGGQPCVRGLRMPVALVVNLVANGMTDEEILEAYPYLEREDIRQCLLFAAATVRDESYHMLEAVG